MILRRISDALRRQDWAVVLIEFVLVIAGVLIALQVNNWNEARREKALEAQYLERLFADLNGSIEDFNVNYYWDLKRVESQNSALDILRSGDLPAEDENTFAAGLAWAGIHNPQRRRWGTVQELFSTGNITLIRDTDLRADISALGGWYDRNDEVVRDSFARIVPLRATLTQSFQIVRFDPAISDGRAEIIYNFDALASDPVFINTLADIQIQSDLIFSFSYGSMARFVDLRDRLALRLGVDDETLPKLPEIGKRPWRLDTEPNP